MTSITSRAYFENYSKLILWRDILEPEGFRWEKLEKINGSEEYVLGWYAHSGMKRPKEASLEIHYRILCELLRQLKMKAHRC